MGKTKFTGKELRALGFTLTQDGGTSYYILLLSPANPIESDYLASDDIKSTGDTVGVQFNNAGEYLTEEQIKTYTNGNGN